MRFSIGIDVGGTFTDLSVLDHEAVNDQLKIFKALSTLPDPAVGVFDVLDSAARSLAISVEALLSQTGFLGLGSTVATNVMVEGRGAKVALIATEGFRDSLAIRRGIRQDVWDIGKPHPTELVPRWLRFTLAERIGASGEVIKAPCPADVERLVDDIEAAGVEAVAVCLYNSYLNDTHEAAVAQALRRRLPEIFISVSSELMPVIGEYERTSTAVVNAYVGPKTVHYLRRLCEGLTGRGLPCEPLIMQSNGGLVNVAMLSTAPVRAVLSGPAAGASAALGWAETSNNDNVVFFDMGGTSIDILVTQNKKVGSKAVTDIEGYHMAVPSIDIRTIGTGGGTIARIDKGGLLRVGPDSAGSTPGPVSYRKGGQLPTVTDANLVLGRLGIDTFLSGSMVLDIEGARAAIDARLATPLGIGLEQAALSVVHIANNNMANSLTILAAESGLDLRDYTLVAAGGASGLHVSAVCRMLGMAGIYVPRQASVACSVGMMQSDVLQDQVISVIRPLGEVDIDGLQNAVEDIVARSREQLTRTGLPEDRQSAEAVAELRYVGQVWSIPVPVALPVTCASLAAAAEIFHAQHQELYHHQHPDGPLELVSLQVNSIGKLTKLEWPRREGFSDAAAGPHKNRTAWFEWSRTPVEIDVWKGDDLVPGQTIAGPAVIEEATTSILLDRGDTATVDGFGNYAIKQSKKGSAA
ncbi:hydantoinase/oxoprolinase family protein [Nitratireductor arenosus]|nr:hydantoinase/oxoprolinase family protein [Nitratireductor arenosus]